MPPAPWMFIERLFIISRGGRRFQAGPEREAGFHFPERRPAANGWKT